MNETVQLLQDVVRNARTGEAAIDHLLEKTECDTMRRELITEKAEVLDKEAYYDSIIDTIIGITE